MRFKNYLLWWILYVLTEDPRQEPVDLSTELLQLLRSQQRVGLGDIVTGDESWFVQHYEYGQIWSLPGDEVPKQVSQTIATPKTMLTVFLGAEVVVFLDWLPTGQRFNIGYFCVHVLGPFDEIMHRRRDMHSARPLMHFDNATPRRGVDSEQCFMDSQFRYAPQPPYSPDVSPCDLFLFGDFITKLRGEEFESVGGCKGGLRSCLVRSHPTRGDGSPGTGLSDSNN